MLQARLRDLLLPDTRPGSDGVRAAARAVKRARRKLFEVLGSDRYSHPALDDVDRKLFMHLSERGGVFIEVGAFDGYFQSNTYWFERFRGWTGVLIEPIPELAAKARRERSNSQVFALALTSPNYADTRVRMRFGGTMSTLLSAPKRLDGAVAHAELGAAIARLTSYDIGVPTSTLSAVLDKACIKQVDLLSLDVEGHEPEVLEGLALARHAPRYILVEILDEQETKPKIDALLDARYDLVEQLSERDYLYRRRET